MTRRLLFVLPLILLFIVSQASAQSENLLIDPGMEGEGYSLISRDPGDDTRYHVPNGWSGGVVVDPSTPPWINAHPNGYPHTGPIKFGGGRSFHMARGGATFTAYVYQQVSTQPESALQGGAWAYIENGSNGRARVGVDPTGGTNPFSPGVVWSDWVSAHYGWVQMSANATAAGGTATLFLFATQDTPSDPNGVYWDNAFLNGIRGAGPISSAGPAQTQPIVTSEASLRVRRGPGLDQARIGAMTPGQSYPLLEDLGEWYAINFNGQTGYVSSAYASINQGSAAASSSAGTSGGPAVQTGVSIPYVVQYTLRLRTAPNNDSQTIRNIPHTATVEAVGRSADNNWLLVNYEGQSGWVASWIGFLQGNISTLPVQ